MELLDALDLAVAEFRARLAGVSGASWSAATPCDEWDVRMLVAHVVGGHLFASLVLSGQTSSEAIATLMSSHVLGDDPLSRHDELARAQRAGFRQLGALDALVDHPLGAITGADFLAMRTFDVTVHAWDLARATEGDEQLDPELAATALASVARFDRGPGFGIVATGMSGADDSDLLRLLDLSGRHP